MLLENYLNFAFISSFITDDAGRFSTPRNHRPSWPRLFRVVKITPTVFGAFTTAESSASDFCCLRKWPLSRGCGRQFLARGITTAPSDQAAFNEIIIYAKCNKTMYKCLTIIGPPSECVLGEATWWSILVTEETVP